MRYFGFTLIPVCILYSKLLKKAYPKTSLGGKQKKTLLGALAEWLLKLDKRLPMPFGVSLILRGARH